jgi:hypothetical protein
LPKNVFLGDVLEAYKSALGEETREGGVKLLGEK